MLTRPTIWLLGLLSCSLSGCSTLGFSLWPAQFPLMTQTKEFAAKSPMPSGLPNELAKQVVMDYFVEPGDRLLLEPIELDSEFRSIGDQEVKVDGSLDLGRFGRLRVVGLTVEEIELAIEDRMVELGAERESINVQLQETNASEIYVLGEVGSPGAYALDGNETVLDVILRAGGLTSKASPCDMILVRPTSPNACRVVLPVCYRQITQLGDVRSNYQLQPGDRVVVGSRTLCEELAFWRQTSSCERCCGSRCVECDPASVGYRNRMGGFLGLFPLPSKNGRDASTPSLEYVPSGVDATSADPSVAKPASPLDMSQESEFFLPANPTLIGD
ncbi:polysaccharide biosynthesis/export family protein [Aureliella helgolandensis]|uniref:SLBB domain protein n=1 Tax=Aureliella helgolandensis TaxID=2527968 RepID=A0A518G411_9BACT|nr:SLBB domain-containing protein [Aureliella helgolandensis]QDV23327.1 SLBB domain protein [Aureliella helgolandensis]